MAKGNVPTDVAKRMYPLAGMPNDPEFNGWLDIFETAKATSPVE
jgi:hypothetical protein